VDELDKLFQRVVRAVRDARPEYLSRPFEVAELLGFVPYRDVRSELGVETNDDYAHAVTRLLAGERGYVFADDLMQDDLKAELASPNPDLAAYRSYVNARITLSQEHSRSVLETLGPSPSSSAIAPHSEATGRPTASRVAAPRRVPASPPKAAAPRALDPDAEAPKRVARPGCRYCGQPLPEARVVHFCPSCGQNLLVRRCAACSSELEAGWKFCVACGRAAAS
jgi:predicted RNA-binding Zn-ribbon protein involved in translation (DUF1610 family)